MSRSRARRAHDERGVVLVLMALFIVAMLTMVAIVVDLGSLRADRRDNQKSSDMAALAAGYHLAGKASGSSAVANPRAACHAALASMKANVVGFPSSAGLGCDSLPANATVCENADPTMPMQTLVSTGSGSFVMTVKYPVYQAEIDDPRFAGGVGALDGTDHCARMKVELESTRATSFASVVGVSEQTIDASSVVKSNLDSTGKNVAALLLLERSNCAVLDTGGQGKVIVQSPSNLNPGRIQADSEGKGNCTTNNNAGGFVVYSASSGNSRIEVQPTADGKPGVIGIFSLSPGVDGRGGAAYTSATAANGLSVEPVAGQISSRLPVDEKHNPPGRTAITDLHARAWSAVTSPAPAGATLIEGAQCNTPGDILGAVVHVNCAEFVAGTATRFLDASRIHFTGKVTVASGRSLSMPVAERVYIRGCQLTASNSVNCGNNATGQSNAYSLRVDGTLLINAASYGPCPTFTPPLPVPPATTAPTLTHRITEVATVGGPVVFSAGSNVSMCQTFLYTGRSSSTYAIQQRNSGAPNCSADYPCPAEGTGTDNALTPWVDEGYMNMPSGGGSGSAIHWSAPNRSSGPATTQNPFEDLAMWGESSRPSFLKGTGSSRVSGVFFLPNSVVTLLGQGDSNQPLNAQFISRGLSISGQGTVVLRPNPDDAVSTPAPGGYSLIR